MKRFISTLTACMLLVACGRTTSKFQNDHYVKRTPVIIEGKGKRETVVAYQVEEWHREKHDAAQTTLWKQDKFNIDTSDDGHLKMSSETMQTDKQVVGSTAPIRHIIWGLALSNMFKNFAEFAGAAFETWSNNEAAVDMEKIETDGEVKLGEIDAMD